MNVDRDGLRKSILASLRAGIDALERLTDDSDSIAAAGDMLLTSLRAGGKIMFCGNGGSAALAQHLAAELTGRFLKERAPLAALSLNADSSALTAIGNDYGFEQIFARQLRGIGRAGDVLVGISTSGNSPNIVAALQAAREAGISTIGLGASAGGAMMEFCDICIRAPASRTDQIQELHNTIGHILCGLVEAAL